MIYIFMDDVYSFTTRSAWTIYMEYTCMHKQFFYCTTNSCFQMLPHSLSVVVTSLTRGISAEYTTSSFLKKNKNKKTRSGNLSDQIITHLQNPFMNKALLLCESSTTLIALMKQAQFSHHQAAPFDTPWV